MVRRGLIFLVFGSVLGLVLLPLLHARAANGASLYISPASGSFTVGSTFTISIFVNTSGRSVNAIEADLRFPADKLQVVSPTAGSSFVAVWVTQPTYSNTLGTLNFKGGIPSPGIKTDAGLISTVTFRVRAIGTATITFTDKTKVLLDDGKGTDILVNTSGGSYTLILPPPEGPEVISPTHQDQSKWYRNQNPAFVWQKDEDIRGFSYIVNQQPLDIPDDISEGSLTQINYKNIGDGTWFFHIKALGATGWGGVSHYAVNIDATPPSSFPITVFPRKRTVVRQPIIAFDMTDQSSGVDHFEIKLIKVGGNPGITTAADLAEARKELTPFFVEAASPYPAPVLALGSYDIVIRAFDRAGNFREETGNVKIVSAIFTPFGDEGFLIRGGIVITWKWLWIIAGACALLFIYLVHFFYRAHNEVEAKLARGVWNIGHKVAEDLGLLLAKKKEYGNKNPERKIVINPDHGNNA